MTLQTPAFSVSGMDARAAAFEAAVRHSQRVRTLRRAMPILAAVLALAFVASILFDPRTALTSVADIKTLGIENASIRMERPKLAGFNADQRGYEVTADKAEQSLSSPHLIDLSALLARIQIKDTGWARLVSPLGHFNAESQKLVLQKDVQISTDEGDKVSLSSADVDLKAGRISSQEPVKVQVGTTNIAADSMEVTESGNHVVFQGSVRMTMQPKQKDGEPL